MKKSGMNYIVNKPFLVSQVIRSIQEGVELKDNTKRRKIKTAQGGRRKKLKKHKLENEHH